MVAISTQVSRPREIAAALDAGIHPETLYQLIREGRLTRLARGLYRLSSAEEFSKPDLTLVAVKVYRFDAATFEEGIEVHPVDGLQLRVYGATSRPILFRYLKQSTGVRATVTNRDILGIARLLRQEMSSYLEAVL